MIRKALILVLIVGLLPQALRAGKLDRRACVASLAQIVDADVLERMDPSDRLGLEIIFRDVYDEPDLGLSVTQKQYVRDYGLEEALEKVRTESIKRKRRQAVNTISRRSFLGLGTGFMGSVLLWGAAPFLREYLLFERTLNQDYGLSLRGNDILDLRLLRQLLQSQPRERWGDFLNDYRGLEKVEDLVIALLFGRETWKSMIYNEKRGHANGPTIRKEFNKIYQTWKRSRILPATRWGHASARELSPGLLQRFHDAVAALPISVQLRLQAQHIIFTNEEWKIEQDEEIFPKQDLTLIDKARKLEIEWRGNLERAETALRQSWGDRKNEGGPEASLEHLFSNDRGRLLEKVTGRGRLNVGINPSLLAEYENARRVLEGEFGDVSAEDILGAAEDQMEKFLEFDLRKLSRMDIVPFVEAASQISFRQANPDIRFHGKSAQIYVYKPVDTPVDAVDKHGVDSFDMSYKDFSALLDDQVQETLLRGLAVAYTQTAAGARTLLRFTNYNYRREEIGFAPLPKTLRIQRMFAEGDWELEKRFNDYPVEFFAHVFACYYRESCWNKKKGVLELHGSPIGSLFDGIGKEDEAFSTPRGPAYGQPRQGRQPHSPVGGVLKRLDEFRRMF